MKKGDDKDNDPVKLVDDNMKFLLQACMKLKTPTMEELKPKMVNFGKKDSQKVLILDMDETLIHAKFHNETYEELEQQCLGYIPGEGEGECDQFNLLLGSSNQHSDMYVRLNVKVRQHMEEVLQYLATLYEICVFTAGEQDYADAILDFIDEERTIIKHRLYRHHCVKAAPRVYIKDLRIIADRELKDIIIVDNSVVSFIFNMSNGVPISDFRGQKNDDELMFMVSYLEEIFAAEDVRKPIAKTFKLE